MTRRTKIILGVIVALPVLAAAAALVAVFLVLPRMDLAPRVAARLTAELGRAVTVESVQVTPGTTTTVTLRAGPAGIASIYFVRNPDKLLRLGR